MAKLFRMGFMNSSGMPRDVGMEQQRRMTALISAGLCGLCARSVTLAGFTGTPDICYDCKDVQWQR